MTDISGSMYANNTYTPSSDPSNQPLPSAAPDTSGTSGTKGSDGAHGSSGVSSTDSVSSASVSSQGATTMTVTAEPQEVTEPPPTTTDSGSTSSVSLGAIMAMINEVTAETTQNQSKLMNVNNEMTQQAASSNIAAMEGQFNAAETAYGQAMTGAILSGTGQAAGGAMGVAGGASSYKASQSAQASLQEPSSANGTNPAAVKTPAGTDSPDSELTSRDSIPGSDRDSIQLGRSSIADSDNGTSGPPSSVSLKSTDGDTSTAPKSGSDKAPGEVDRNKTDPQTQAEQDRKIKLSEAKMNQAQAFSQSMTSGGQLLGSVFSTSGDIMQAQSQKTNAQAAAIADGNRSVAQQANQNASNDCGIKDTLNSLRQAMQTVSQAAASSARG